MHNILETIRIEEDLFPKNFTNFEEHDYGILFYNTKAPDSYDSNHAVIYKEKVTDLSLVLQEIISFYLNQCLLPTIYQATGDINYFIDNKDVLEANGYSVCEEGPLEFMLLSEKNQIIPSTRLIIECITEWDERIANDILIPSGEPWEIEVVKNNVLSSKHKVFVAYTENKAVAVTYIHVSEIGCCRFDYIIVAKEYRKNGYARELLSHVTNYCRDNNLANCYQWPANETSKQVCLDAGFRMLFTETTARAFYKNP